MDKQLLEDIFLYGCNKYVPDRVTYNKNKRRGGVTKEKKRLIEAARTDCQHCGAKETEFHHIEPYKFRISRYREHSIDDLILELDKCICLCRTCHMAVHREEKVERAKRKWAEVRAANPEAKRWEDVSRPNR